MTVEASVRIGGLMRCCLATLEDAMARATVAPREGDTIECRYKCGSQMIFHDHAWQWDQPKPVDPGDPFGILKVKPRKGEA